MDKVTPDALAAIKARLQSQGGAWGHAQNYRDDILALVAEVERLRAEVESLRAHVDALSKDCGQLENDREYNAELVRERDATIARLMAPHPSLNETDAAVAAAKRAGWNSEDITLAVWIAALSQRGAPETGPQQPDFTMSCATCGDPVILDYEDAVVRHHICDTLPSPPKETP